MIRLEIDSIPEGTSHIEVVEEACELDLGDEQDIISPDSPLRLEFTATRSGGEILLKGRVGLDVKLDCARCLKEFGTTLNAGLNILCVLGGGSSEAGGYGDREGVIEVPARARYIDLTDEIRSELVVRVPVKPLCEPGCKGLCPICGENLNETKCSCRRDDHDSRWDALKKLK